MHFIRVVVLSLLILVIGLFALSYFAAPGWSPFSNRTRPATVGTTGTIDVDKARARGAEVGEKVAIAAEKMKDSAAEAALTSKIKAKMMLDDSIKARAIDVTTNGTTVTLSGTVGSAGEHERAVRLARETAGVTHVVDRIRADGR
jgi:osmotically-inducible protein OsmY